MKDLRSRINPKEEDEDPDKPKFKKLPEDALLEAQLPPLSKMGISVSFLVRSPQLSVSDFFLFLRKGQFSR